MSGTKRSWSRQRWLLAVLLPALLVAGAAVLLRTEAPTAPEVGCYAAASLDADTAVLATDGRSPLDVCAEVWASGALVVGANAPRVLEACVVPSGSVGVFPGDRPGVCDRLGLPAAHDP